MLYMQKRGDAVLADGLKPNGKSHITKEQASRFRYPKGSPKNP